MFCENCGCELSDDATFCSGCGSRVGAGSRDKNIYIALVLTFLLTGLGSIYAGNVKKGLVLLILRLLFAVIGLFLSVFLVFSVLVWTYAFYEVYKDVQIANGRQNPKLLADFRTWDQNRKVIAILIVSIIAIFTLFGCAGLFSMDHYTSTDSGTHYHSSGSSASGSGASSSGGGSSHSSHYGGVDTSPNSIAKHDPDWYYDHYEYGDNPDIDDYLESEGFD